MKTYPVYLNGKFIETTETVSVTNPATAESFARMSTVDRARVAQALRDAQAAFLGWRKQTDKVRIGVREWYRHIPRLLHHFLSPSKGAPD